MGASVLVLAFIAILIAYIQSETTYKNNTPEQAGRTCRPVQDGRSCNVAAMPTTAQEPHTDGASTGKKENPFDSAASMTPAQRQMYNEMLDNARSVYRKKKRHAKEVKDNSASSKRYLQNWYSRVFQCQPTNPMSSLKDVDSSTLEKITSRDGWKAGGHIGKTIEVSDWLNWFENVEEYNGLPGMIAISMLRGILASTNVFKSKLSILESKRVLAVLDSFATAWQGHNLSVAAQCNLSGSLQEISPVTGGLEFIRKWTVENPFGDEALESNLVETLHYWPIKESGAIAVEALALSRAGAIKGVTDSWLAAQRRYHGCVWIAEEVKNLLALPLGQAVKEATKMTGILYAELFAGDDLLAAQALEIGNTLMARRDSIGASSYGFIFIRRDDIALSDSLWTEWFNSSDEYKIKAACTATNLGMGAVCRTDNVLDRMYSLAVNIESSKGIRSAAAWPLSVLDSSGRALDLLESWLSEGESQSACLIAIGRIVVRAPKAEVVALLKNAINEGASTPAQRHYPLFLLATVAPKIALEYCDKDLPFTSKFETLSILLSAATAQAQLTTANDNSDERVEAIYKQLSMPEPDWIRAIRLNLDIVKGHTSEQRVASYPASRP